MRAASQREELPRSNPSRASAPPTSAMKSAGTTAVSEVFINSRMSARAARCLGSEGRKAAIATLASRTIRILVETIPAESLAYRHGGRAAALLDLLQQGLRLGGSHRAVFRGPTLGDRHGHNGRGRLAMPKNENPLTPVFRGVDELRKVGFGMNQRRLLHVDQYDHFYGETQIGPNVRHQPSPVVGRKLRRCQRCSSTGRGSPHNLWGLLSRLSRVTP